MKKLFYILIFIIGINFTSFAQTSSNPEQVTPAKLIKFYPNPATSAINFDFVRGYDRSFSLMIFNFMGKQVYEVKSIQPRMNINLEDFYRGIYIFQLRDKNGTIVETGKFQVTK
ncbi:MAG: T9SS type A sorting domain-containing protein [Ferruginibacter sp.]